MSATAGSSAGCSASVPRTRLGIRRRRPLLGTLGSLVAATAAAFAATVGGGVSAASASTHDWIATGWNIHLANQLDPATTGHFFDTSSSFGTGPSASVNPVIDGFAANAVLVYSSYAQFAGDQQSGHQHRKHNHYSRTQGSFAHSVQTSFNNRIATISGF